MSDDKKDQTKYELPRPITDPSIQENNVQPKDSFKPVKIVSNKLWDSIVVVPSFPSDTIFPGPFAPSSPSSPGGGGKNGFGLSKIKFFEIEGTANRVIFVTDTSLTMKDGAELGRSYMEVVQELERALKGLNSENYFNIIAFDRYSYSYRPQLLRASDTSKAQAVAWLTRFNPEKRNLQPSDTAFSYQIPGEVGSTRAYLAIEKAIEQKPDMIYFISDGARSMQDPEKFLHNIKLWQTQGGLQIPIHTIFYKTSINEPENNSSKEFMKRLARENRGTFKSIE